jgi:Fur family transcriptional regulator, iron response regulator
MRDLLTALRAQGIQPTAQRLAVARFVLESTLHPTADEVWERVRRLNPTLSRATVYNTLNLFVEKGLLRTQAVREGALVFDPRVERHHHFIDDGTGEIHDVPWDAVRVTGGKSLRGYDVREYQVVMRGRKRQS